MLCKNVECESYVKDIKQREKNDDEGKGTKEKHEEKLPYTKLYQCTCSTEI